jgi:hypothetical protein
MTKEVFNTDYSERLGDIATLANINPATSDMKIIKVCGPMLLVSTIF